MKAPFLRFGVAHRPVALTTLCVVLSGMAYTLWWQPLVYHESGPLLPADFFASLSDGNTIATGGLLHVYGNGMHLVTLPGFPLLLAPIAGFCHGWSAMSQWLLTGPLAMSCVGVLLAAVDRLGTCIGVSGRRRVALLVLAGAAAWPALAMWGHPEDVLAVALCCRALAAAAEQRWRSAAWMLGGALCFQLFAVLIVPVVLAPAGLRKLPQLLVVAATLPGTFLAVLLAGDFSATWAALTRQPNYPALNHPTPWIVLAAHMGPGEVSAGPGRLLALLSAVTLGLLALRIGRDPCRLLWLAAGAFAARCLFESVMDGYYVLPAIVSALVLAAAGHQDVRFLLAGLAAMAVVVDTAQSAGMWTYWLEMSIGIAFLLAIVFPVGSPAEPEIREVSTDQRSPALDAR